MVTLKKQIYFLFVGSLAALLFGTSTNLILPIFGISQLSILGPLSGLILTGSIAYAIARHRLLELKLWMSEIFSIFIVIILIIELFLSKSNEELFIKLGVLGLVIFGAYQLVKSVAYEIRKREELQRLATELRAANKKLAELDALKTEFVSIASHELLTPISAIQGYLSMILDEKILPMDDPKTAEILKKVYDSSNRLAKLVTDLLNVSRIESGRLIVEKQSFDINKVIQIAVSELKVKADQKNLKLLWSPQVHPKVIADKDKLKQVLTNVIGNAIKYTEKGKIEITTEVEKDKELGIKLEGNGSNIKKNPVKGDFIVVHIKDTGVGIPEEELGNIFKKFSRLGDWQTRSTGGTGLGLYIAKNIIELLGGKIWAESEYGKGSIFSFSVPLAKNADPRGQDIDRR